MKLAMLMMTATLVAQEVDEKMLRLIGPDATVVLGVNVLRYRGSKLHELGPLNDAEIASIAPSLRQLITVECREKCGASLTIVRGSVTMGDRAAKPYRGIPVSEGERAIAILDPSTALIGRPEAVMAAIGRFLTGATNDGEIAAMVRRASGRWDNWIVAIKPLEHMQDEISFERPRAHWENLAKSVRQICGGLRFGGVVDAHLEAEANSPEDAVALAAVARWIPGFMQAKTHGSMEARVLEIVENFSTETRGSTASLSFSISEARLGEMVAKMRSGHEGK